MTPNNFYKNRLVPKSFDKAGRPSVVFIALFLITCNLFSQKSREEIMLDSISVSGTESLLYQDKNIFIKGDILIKDKGTLTFINCNIQPQQAFHQQFLLKVLGNGKLIVKKSKVTTRDWTWYNWYYYDNATVTFEDFDYDILWQSIDWKSTGTVNAIRSKIGLTVPSGDNQKSTLTITDSPSVYLELGLPKGKTTITLPARNSFVTSWSPPVSVKVAVINSRIEKMDIDLSPGVDVTVKDTKDLSFGWALGISGNKGPYKLTGLQRKHYDQATFSADDASLTLKNTSVDGWWPTTFNEIVLEISDADLVDPRTWQKSRMMIRNSRINLFASNDDSSADIEDSFVEDNIHALGNSRISLKKIKKGSKFKYTNTDKGMIIEDGVPVDVNRAGEKK